MRTEEAAAVFAELRPYLHGVAYRLTSSWADAACGPSPIRAYNAAGGWAALTVGATVCLIAYRLMPRLGRLPEDAGVLLD